jgi:anti-sigma B factor antagonist/stage II sporulation protein AA (anti-sigma F factor antagonist)
VTELLQVVGTDDPRRVRLVGELDASNADSLVEELGHLLSTSGDLVLELSELTFVDSTGLRSFLRIAEALDSTGKLVLDGPQRLVARTLELVGLDRAPNIAVLIGPPAES